MIGYALYFLLAVGLTILLTAAFRRLRRDDETIVSSQEDAAFDRRMEAIERDFGRDRTDRR